MPIKSKNIINKKTSGYPKCNKRYKFTGWDWTDVLKALGYNWENLCTNLENEIIAKVGEDYNQEYDKDAGAFKCISRKDPNIWSWDSDVMIADVLRAELDIANEYVNSIVCEWDPLPVDKIKRAKEVIWAARKHCEAVGKYGMGYGGPVYLNLCKQDDFTFLMFFRELFTWMWS